MKLDNLMKMIEVWANTRNDSVYALIENELYDLFQAAGLKLEQDKLDKNLSDEFINQLKMIWKNKSVKGGNEPILISAYNHDSNKIEIYESMGDAARLLEGNQGKISNCIKDGTRHKERAWAKVFKI